MEVIKMRDIVIFKKEEEKYEYSLWITFDKDEELEDWLNTTTQDKDKLLIMRQYKKRN
jgi:antibiotic biosynthesis monooxygenase (ABM) superfamily enzyme